MARRLSAIFTSGLSADDKTGAAKSASNSRQSSPVTSRSKSPGKLSKHMATSSQAPRSTGQPYLTPSEATIPSNPEARQNYTSNGADLDPILIPPPSIMSTEYNSRANSRDRSRPGTSGWSTPRSRPVTPSIQLPDQPSIAPAPDGGERKKKHWWNRSKDKDDDDAGPAAWIAGHPQREPYDTAGLVSGKPMQELWNEQDGNCYVYLSPKTANKGASFKVDSAVFASSPVLTKLAFGDIYSTSAIASGDRRSMPMDGRMQQLSINDPATPPMSPKRGTEVSSSTSSHDSRGRYSNFSDSSEAHLYLPVKLSSEVASSTTATPSADANASLEDLQTLVDYRNFFAFLCGQSLVATERRSTFFHIFMTIAGILKSYQFSNVDGSTYGEVANASFDNYVEELGLADVRASRDKTIEGIVLGERMKSVLLYNEAFTHGVGKHEDLLALKSPKYNMISPITQNRLARASMDLDKRVASVRLTMTDFELPFLFAGIMNSKVSVERKEGVRFDQWKEHFLGMRKFIMGLYKQRYGDWPPKASSKKNTLETSGLNRLVLRDVYHDMSSLYDLLADRNKLTTRTIDGVNDDEGRDPPVIRGLRAVLSEYDRSSPPVKPPVPFDLPRIPTLRSTRKEFGTGDAKKDTKALYKKIKDDELQLLLRKSWNDDAAVTPFVDAFREMEKRAAHGCNILELEDMRIGQWIFVYVVLQALPMLACDAPGLRWTKGAEYFLCEPPRSGVPWADSHAAGSGAGRRTWFSVGGAGGGVVSLPSDVVEHGVEGIYRRSHCWEMAEKWCAANPILSEALHMQQSTGGAEYGDGGLPAPPSGNDLLRPDSRNSSASNRSSKRYSSFGLNLEALPLPNGVTPDGSMPSPVERPRTPAHSVDTSKTFDSILAGANNQNKSKKKR